MMTHTINDIQCWLKGLCEDDFPEDQICKGDPDQAVKNVMVCWFANRQARAEALRRGADLIIMHETIDYEQQHQDAGCLRAQDWLVNRQAHAFFDEHRIGVIRSHRTLDSYCIPTDFAEHLGLPKPIVCTGHKGYMFTLVYQIDPLAFSDLANQLKQRMGMAMVRTSATEAQQSVSKLGMGWGGVSISQNLQYMELLRQHGVDVVIGGEVDEYSLEYFRDNGIAWIELGHYASEIIGLRRVARDMAVQFPQLSVSDYIDGPRVNFL